MKRVHKKRYANPNKPKQTHFKLAGGQYSVVTLRPWLLSLCTNFHEKTVFDQVFSIKVDAIFPKIEISKKFYDVHFRFYMYIFSQSFSFFVLGAKLRPSVVRLRRLSKKMDFFARDSAPPFFFKKFIKIFFLYLNTCRNMDAKPNCNIFIYFF